MQLCTVEKGNNILFFNASDNVSSGTPQNNQEIGTIVALLYKDNTINTITKLTRNRTIASSFECYKILELTGDNKLYLECSENGVNTQFGDFSGNDIYRLNLKSREITLLTRCIGSADTPETCE